MGLILSLDNSIHSFNTGKFVLDQYTGAAAAYSLRRLSVNSTNVVRVRRSVDNAEDDFTADEVADGTMLNWVNADMPLPLDTATAAAAYSLRNLKTSYTGSVIRVRRSSDNAEADFTADEITDGTLLSWVGNTASDNGFVTTWYDQSGNSNDATQGTAANQPKIVDAGVLVEENGKPAVDFDGVDDKFQQSLPNDFYGTKDIYFFAVTKNATSSETGGITQKRDGALDGNFGVGTAFGKYEFISRDTATALASLRTTSTYNTQEIVSVSRDSSGLQMYSPETLTTASAVADLTSTGVSMIGQGDSFGSLEGIIQEIIIFDSDQSSNRTNIETNINDYYSIYAQDRDGFVTT